MKNGLLSFLNNYANDGAVVWGGYFKDIPSDKLHIGVEVEKEHKDLYDKLKKRLRVQGVEMPISEQEFYETIVKAHFKEDEDYYDLLLKYVEKKKMTGGGNIDYENILDMPRGERLVFIRMVLEKDKGLIATKREYDLITNGVNSLIEKYFKFNKANPFKTRRGDKIFFEAISPKNDLESKVRYASHFVTGDTKDGKRAYDSSKTSAIYFIMSLMSSAEKIYHEPEKNRIIYAKQMNIGRHCCMVLRIETSLEGGLRAYTILPNQTLESMERKEASGRWTDASHSARYSKKSSSCATQSQAGDDTISPQFNNKDKNNSDNDNENEEKLSLGGKTAIFGVFYDKNDDIIGIGKVAGGKFYYDSFTKEPVPTSFHTKEISSREYNNLKEKKLAGGGIIVNPKYDPYNKEGTSDYLVMAHVEGNPREFEKKVKTLFNKHKKEIVKGMQSLIPYAKIDDIELYGSVAEGKSRAGDPKKLGRMSRGSDIDIKVYVSKIKDGYTDLDVRDDLYGKIGIPTIKGAVDIGVEESDNKMAGGGKTDDFANSEKGRIFVPSKITKDELQSIISGKSKISNGDTIQATLAYIRREEGANSINRGTKPDTEEERLIKFIDSNNLWYKGELNPDDSLGRGGEHIVYEYPNDEDFVLKTNNLSNYQSWSDYLINLLLNNTFFPDTSYELIGFKKNEHGNVLPVVRQHFVAQATIANLKDVQAYLFNRGFQRVHPLVNAYRNWDLGIMLGDLHNRNVLLKDGVLFFIDTKFFISHNVDYIYNKGGIMSGGGETDDFTSSGKSRIFVPNKPTKDEISHIISGTRPVAGGIPIQTASAYLRRNAGASPKSEDSELYKRQEAEHLKKYATQNSLWFTNKLAGGGKTDDFASSEKSSIFTLTKITKEDVNQTITGARSVTNGAAIQAAASYLRRSESSIPSDRGSNLRGQDEERLREYISQNNLWLPEPDPARKFGYGGEAQIYLYGDYVIKSNDAHFYDSWEGYFNSLLIHNLFFPITSYELIGFYEYKDFDNRILYALVKQVFIETPDKTNLLEVRKFMYDLGFIHSGGKHYHHPELGIELKDIHEGNALTKDGVLYFVDTIFYLKDKMTGGGEADDKIGIVGDKLFYKGKHISDVIYDASLKLFLIHYSHIAHHNRIYKKFRSADRDKAISKFENYLHNNKLAGGGDIELDEYIKEARARQAEHEKRFREMYTAKELRFDLVAEYETRDEAESHANEYESIRETAGGKWQVLRPRFGKGGEVINKYLVKEEVPYEGKNTWTVFASSREEALALVKEYAGKDAPNRIDTFVDILQHNIRGTKQKGIIKHSYY